MNYAKLDAALAAELVRSGSALFDVSVRFTEPVTDVICELLNRSGIASSVGEQALNGSLPRESIDILSEMPSVRSIRMSGRSRPL